MGNVAPAASDGRRSRVAWGVLCLLLLPAASYLPAQAERAARRWSVLRAHEPPDQRLRTIQGGAVDVGLIQAADRLLPRGARVVVVTAGRDPRRSEYAAFHRTQYLLAPRQIWWLTGAPRDGTWESRWWHPDALTRDSIAAFASAHRISHVLVFGTTIDLAVGDLLVDGPGGCLLSLMGGGTGHDPPYAATWATRSVPPALGAALFWVFVLGLGVLAWADPRGHHRSHLGAVANAWWVGSLLLTVGMFWLDRMRVALDAQRLILPSLGVIALAAALGWGLARRRRQPPRVVPAPAPATSPADPHRALANVVACLSVAILAVNVVVVVLLAAGQPLEAWDSWSHWAARARAIFRGGVDAALVMDADRFTPHLAYPLAIPLREAWVFSWLGAPDDRWVATLTAIDYLALLALVWTDLRARHRSRAVAAAATAVVAAIFTLGACAAAGLPDVTIALLVTAGVLRLQHWARDAHASDLALAGLAVGTLGWIKAEGAILTAVVMVCALTMRVPLRQTLRGLACIAAGFCATTMPWWLYLRGSPGPGDFAPITVANVLGGLGRAGAIATQAGGVLSHRLLGWVWPAAGVVGVLRATLLRRSGRGGRDWRDPGHLPVAVAAAYAVVMTLPYLVSTNAPLEAHVRNSYYRVAAQVTPLLVVWIARLAADAPRVASTPASDGQPLTSSPGRGATAG